MLLWEGNLCLDFEHTLVQWDDVVEACELDDDDTFLLAHCFTMLVSQALTRYILSDPSIGYEKLDKARQMGVSILGVHFEGVPSDEWLAKLAIVVDELIFEGRPRQRRGGYGPELHASAVVLWWLRCEFVNIDYQYRQQDAGAWSASSGRIVHQRQTIREALTTKEGNTLYYDAGATVRGEVLCKISNLVIWCAGGSKVSWSFFWVVYSKLCGAFAWPSALSPFAVMIDSVGDRPLARGGYH